MDFTGAGVIVSNVGSAVTINIPGSNGTPTGPNNSLQYNSVGTLAGAANLTFNPSTSVLSVIGNVQAGYFAGDATRLFNIQGANIVGQIPFAASSNTANTALTAVTAGTVTIAAQPAITSVGTLTSVAATGNITTTGAVSATGNIVAAGNVRGGNIGTTGLIVAVGNIYAQGNLGTAGNMFATGNIGGGNINIGGSFSAAGNVRGLYLQGDGSEITNLPPGDYNNANVTTLLASFGSNVISATGNITTTANVAGGNLKTTGLISATGDITGGNVNAGATIVATTHNGATFSATGNVTGGNINTGGIVTAAGNVTGGNLRTVGQVSATGNITGDFFVGNGSLLTGIEANYGNSNVSTYLGAGQVGNIIPLSNAVYSLGNATNQWAELYVSNNSIIIGGVTLAVSGNTLSVNGTDLVTNTALGVDAGGIMQGYSAIAIGTQAGNLNQGLKAIAIGDNCGRYNQSGNAIAIGAVSGRDDQGAEAVAFGRNTGLSYQGTRAIAVGTSAGQSNQSPYAIALGYQAGQYSQGANSVSIGAYAGMGDNVGGFQGNNSIVINATGANLTNQTANTFTVAPVRNLSNVGNVMFYNASTSEVTYGNTISVSGNISAVNFIGSGVGTFRLPNLNSAQIANLTASNGDMLYNTTVNKLQAYENGAWANII
jgi:hypothetical protein